MSYQLLATLTLLLYVLQAQEAGVLPVGMFSAEKVEGGLPADWKLFFFKNVTKHTEYALLRDHGTMVVRAQSANAASGLARSMRIDPRQYPILEWRWKVVTIPGRSDVHKKAGDDYPARIFINFVFDAQKAGFWDRLRHKTVGGMYGLEAPGTALNYIWAGNGTPGSIIASPFTSRVQMVVIESGNGKISTWITEQRNIIEDYKKAFGQDPPAISSIAIMTDTDNTGESATAYYGDIVLRNAPHPQ